jgi:hypothetical protein
VIFVSSPDSLVVSRPFHIELLLQPPARRHEKTYKYDDTGDRIIKRGPQGETVYVNQFYTDRPGATGTKHVYAGTTRVASKLLRQDVQGANPNGKTPFEKDIYFYHPDHLGSSSYITDRMGSCTKR